MNIETLFLDAGGVLVHPNWDRVAGALGGHGVAVSPAALQGAEHLAKKDLDTEERIKATNDDSRGWLYFNLVLEKAGIPLSAGTDAALADLAAYHAGQNLWESVFPDVVPSLERFRAAGLRIVVVSNANGTVEAQMDRLGLAPYFDHVVDSAVEGVEKPDPRIFQRALERSGGRPDRTLHVGDLYHVDVVGARAAGLAGWLLDAAALYEGYDCPRFPSLTALADELLGSR
jgi:putative hydrolase of the HAD superfamily